MKIKSYSAHPNTELRRLRSIFIAKMAPQPIVLILGAGPRLGSAIASKFASQNFKVVLASRSLSDGVCSPEGYLRISADLPDPGSFPRVFSAIKARLGAPPTLATIVVRLFELGTFRQLHIKDDAQYSYLLQDAVRYLPISWKRFSSLLMIHVACVVWINYWIYGFLLSHERYRYQQEY